MRSIVNPEHWLVQQLELCNFLMTREVIHQQHVRPALLRQLVNHPQPVHHHARTEAVHVSLELIRALLDVHQGVAEAGLAVDPVDDAAIV